MPTNPTTQHSFDWRATVFTFALGAFWIVVLAGALSVAPGSSGECPAVGNLGAARATSCSEIHGTLNDRPSSVVVSTPRID